MKANLRKLVREEVINEITKTEGKLLSKYIRDYAQSNSKYNNFLVITEETLENYANAFRAAVYGKGRFSKKATYKTELKKFFVGISKKPPLSNNVNIDITFLEILQNAGLVIGSTVFYIPGSFNSLKEKTKTFNEEFIEQNMIRKQYDHEVFGKNLELDHGNAAAALSHLGGPTTLMAHAKKVKKLDTKEEYEAFLVAVMNNVETAVDAVFPNLSTTSRRSKINYFSNVISSWEVFVDPTNLKLRAGLSFLITPSTKRQNAGKATIEKKEFQIMQDSIIVAILSRDMLEFQGSPSIKQKVAGALIKKATPSSVGKNLVVSAKIKDKVQPKSNKTSHKEKVPQQNKRGKAKKEKKLSFNPGNGKAQGTLPDIRSFIGILNSKINSTVAKNMGSPALNYRTGRFAESVRIQNIIRTNKGFPSIEYTYMRYPYEVFEYPGSGNPLAQEGQRDPRRLIEGSIREIMAQYAIGRFYTRRV